MLIVLGRDVAIETIGTERADRVTFSKGRREIPVAFVYETAVDPNALNNSHAFALDMVGCDRRVLEVGCAAGHVTRILRDRGCQVVAIEIDAVAAAHAGQWAERSHRRRCRAGRDLGFGWLGRFDVVVFG